MEMENGQVLELGASPEELYGLFAERVKADSLRKHCLATRAIMEKLAGRLGESKVVWGWAGLLHDLDFEETKDAPERHGLVTAELLAGRGVNGKIVEAIIAHNAEALGRKRETLLDYALSAAETITGLIVAAALVRPDKKLAGVEVQSVRRRMKEKAFARNVNRETILLCEKIGIPLEEFISISLEAMKEISDMLDL